MDINSLIKKATDRITQEMFYDKYRKASIDTKLMKMYNDYITEGISKEKAQNRCAVYYSSIQHLII